MVDRIWYTLNITQLIPKYRAVWHTNNIPSETRLIWHEINMCVTWHPITQDNNMVSDTFTLCPQMGNSATTVHVIPHFLITRNLTVAFPPGYHCPNSPISVGVYSYGTSFSRIAGAAPLRLKPLSFHNNHVVMFTAGTTFKKKKFLRLIRGKKSTKRIDIRLDKKENGWLMFRKRKLINHN